MVPIDLKCEIYMKKITCTLLLCYDVNAYQFGMYISRGKIHCIGATSDWYKFFKMVGNFHLIRTLIQYHNITDGEAYCKTRSIQDVGPV